MDKLDIVHARNHVLKTKEIVISIISVEMVTDVEKIIVQIHMVLTLTQIVVMLLLMEMKIFVLLIIHVKQMKVIVIPMKNVKVSSSVDPTIAQILLVYHLC